MLQAGWAQIICVWNNVSEQWQNAHDKRNGSHRGHAVHGKPSYKVLEQVRSCYKIAMEN